MSVSTKNFEDNRFRLVQKQDINKRERVATNRNLKDIARNPSAYIEEDEDDSNFFEFSEE